MGTCYVLGAGFSNAVADLPVMKALVQEFRAVWQREADRGHKNREFWGRELLQYLELMEQRFFAERCLKPGQTYSQCTFTESLESLVSFIDLNLASQIDAVVKDAAGSESHMTKYCAFWERSDLSELRGRIATYLYLALIGPYHRSERLERFGALLSPGDSIVTFNYDLIVETELWRRRLWSPVDGYGTNVSSSPASPAARFETTVPLYKLHGSLNWTSPGLFRQPVELVAFYDDGTPIFPGYLTDETAPLDAWYEGGHDPCWVMPSFVKNFAVPELLAVWARAQDALRDATQVVVIGYSLPEADAAACLLFGAAHLKDKRVVIVDKNEAELRGRFERVLGVTPELTLANLAAYLDTA